MSCKYCGGDMIGDGFNIVFHCEYALCESFEFSSPDDQPVFCENPVFVFFTIDDFIPVGHF
jgi:hypothetical protein